MCASHAHTQGATQGCANAAHLTDELKTQVIANANQDSGASVMEVKQFKTYHPLHFVELILIKLWFGLLLDGDGVALLRKF